MSAKDDLIARLKSSALGVAMEAEAMKVWDDGVEAGVDLALQLLELRRDYVTAAGNGELALAYRDAIDSIRIAHRQFVARAAEADERPSDSCVEPEPPQVTGGPPAPAEGYGPGRWVLLGEVGVDSASIGITDLLMGDESPGLDTPAAAASRYAVPGSEFAADWGTGVRFWAGFGDGGYQVWGWVVDYRDEGDPDPDERVAQVVVTMIDDRELEQWRQG